ncbi:FAD-dependent oxidoreductase [Fulvivirgaceae bacterium BMA10]|uniref:FAD-dependent oxidoreductase n=1 Tax=Splendidivirga corallicola TaxID=3051826 RepID=A0ABT8KGM6_9BACT|nr:FAD-dependent oxidoreductase [Fulvivirgaceae bacterium BMA10]
MKDPKFQYNIMLFPRINYQCLIVALSIGSIMSCSNPKTVETELLIVGGGTSGFSAAIQAARQGIQVTIVEETHWLGGMLTAAGVSATDGNHKLPSGIWGEFRSELYNHYGGSKAVATGWVSNTQFEPWVGDSIMKAMVAKHPNITVFYGYHIISASNQNNKVTGAVFENEEGQKLIINSAIAIDATELGDLMALAGCEYTLGQDDRMETGEPSASDKSTPFIQDLTYVAVLKDYSPEKAPLVISPVNFDYTEFLGTCTAYESNEFPGKHTREQLITYGQLPNKHYMINWPIRGNDSYMNLVELTYEERQERLKEAKERTLAYVHLLQTELGFENLGLASGFNTADSLAIIPYHREGRRLRGMVDFRLDDLLFPFQDEERALYKQGISVGDYPLDHHHDKNELVVPEKFPSIPSFNVPYGSLVPQSIDGLLVAEKGISASHVVNGCTRLQPCVMLTGQAAGQAAAMCILNREQPRSLNLRALQQGLLEADCWLMPFVDINPGDEYFQSIQRVGLAGWMRGEGISVGWANETRFYPDSMVTRKALIEILRRIDDKIELSEDQQNTDQAITINNFLELAFEMVPSDDENSGKQQPIEYFIGKKLIEPLWREKTEEVIRRKDLALLLDQIFQPFQYDLFLKDSIIK